LYERLSSGALSLWVFVFALRLWSLDVHHCAGRLAPHSGAHFGSPPVQPARGSTRSMMEGDKGEH